MIVGNLPLVPSCNISGCMCMPRKRMPDGRLYCMEHAGQYINIKMGAGLIVKPLPAPTVYFVKLVGTSFVKIGMTSDMRQRMSQLRAGIPLELKVLTSWRIDTAVKMVAIEAAIHKYCQRHLHRGEWFKTKGEVLEIIRLVKRNQFEKILSKIGPLDFGAPPLDGHTELG